jgi:dipeptidase D
MNQTLVEKDYKKIFHYFTEISAIPRGSKNNTAVSNYLVNFAMEHGLYYKQDELENVIIIKEATPGYETAPTIIIQGHMDMVCEKSNDSNHDFNTQGLELLVDGDYIYADRTTLGADNGIAVAYTLAFLEDETLKHPRIEAIFTTDEEIGMEGAMGIDVSELKGKYLLNIDSEDEGSILTSSAGGMTATCELPLKRESQNGIKVTVAISELQGGHSGAEINKNRTNAAILMGRLMFELREHASYGLIDMNGGLKDNAIPRDAIANFLVVPEEIEQFSTEVEKLTLKYKMELQSSEPHLKITLTKGDQGQYDCISSSSFEKMLFLLIQMPNGVQVMSSNIPGLVESSLNLGIFQMDQEQLNIYYHIRSSVNSYKQFLADKLNYLAQFLGGEFYIRTQYPAWEYKKDSPFRDHLAKVFIEQYGTEPKFEAIHAGLECSFFAEKIEDVDIVSLGPDMYDIHTPKEKLSIASTVRVYQYLEKVIEGLK